MKKESLLDKIINGKEKNCRRFVKICYGRTQKSFLTLFDAIAWFMQVTSLLLFIRMRRLSFCQH